MIEILAPAFPENQLELTTVVLGMALETTYRRRFGGAMIAFVSLNAFLDNGMARQASVVGRFLADLVTTGATTYPLQ